MSDSGMTMCNLVFLVSFLRFSPAIFDHGFLIDLACYLRVYMLILSSSQLTQDFSNSNRGLVVNLINLSFKENIINYLTMTLILIIKIKKYLKIPVLKFCMIDFKANFIYKINLKLALLHTFFFSENFNCSSYCNVQLMS